MLMRVRKYMYTVGANAAGLQDNNELFPLDPAIERV